MKRQISTEVKRRINSSKLNQWIKKNGDNFAEAKIIESTGYSISTLQKMKDGSYLCSPGFAERKALVDLTQLEMDELFPPVEGEEHAS